MVEKEKNYIQDLRKLVGNQPIIAPGATVLIVNNRGQLLMLLRTDNLCWGLPGGMMELGESIEETAKREVKEETGLEVSDLELFGVYSGKDLYYIYPKGDEVQNISVAFISHVDTPPVLDSREHSDYKFCDLSSMPENVSAPIKPILNDFVEKFKER
jgi:8-oxo-dGTP pyrophosphatase MutT (NUDIX family)